MHWLEELLHTYGQLKVAGEANALDDNQKILAMDRQVVEAHHRRHLQEAFRPPAADSEEDMIHIGDRHDHHHSPAPAAPGRLLKGLAALALLGAGAGSGLGGLFLVQQFLTPPESVSPGPSVLPAIPPANPDEDTLFELRLGPPKGP